MLFARSGDGEDRVLGCWGCVEEDLSCGVLENELESVV